MKKVTSALKRYNANSRNKNTGDCVIRSLSVAFGEDYDEVKRELNKIKRDLNHTRYNITPVFNTFIANKRIVNSGKSKDFDFSGTLSEFCEKYPEGTYILLTGDTDRASTHMVCVIDGDIYDSWDSQSQIVNYIYVVSEGKSQSDHDLVIREIAEDISEFLKMYSEKIRKKMPYAEFTFDTIDYADRYTCEQDIYLSFNSSLPSEVSYLRNGGSLHTIVYKINPRLSDEDNVQKIKEKSRVNLREWAYSIRKEIEDDVNVQHVKAHPNFSGDRYILLKLPEWCRPYVNDIDSDGNTEYTDKYHVYMDPLPEDPRGHYEVIFRADTLSEIIYQINRYQKNYSRPDYDY